MPEELVKYEDVRGVSISLTPAIVRQRLCPNASDQELFMFLRLCEGQRLNPWLREAYLVKYGNAPATLIVGWQVFLTRAEANPYFDGYHAEVYDAAGVPFRGLDGQAINHATAKIYRKDRKYPTVVTVLFSEYCVRNAQGHPQASWAKIPATMIRKVALEQGLRETFTKEFAGMYGPEEMRITSHLPEEPVIIDAEPVSPRVTEPEPPEPEEPEEEETVAAFTPVEAREAVSSSSPKAASRRIIATPTTAAKYLTELHGVMWPRQTIHGKTVGEHYFGRKLTNSELPTFAKSNKADFEAGVTRLLADVEVQKGSKSA